MKKNQKTLAAQPLKQIYSGAVSIQIPINLYTWLPDYRYFAF